MSCKNVNGNKQWIIKIVGDDFLVGVLDQKNKAFEPICKCEFYDQADLVVAALGHYIYAKNYSSREAGGCQKVIGKC